MTNGETRSAAGEAAVCDQGALFAQSHGLEIGGGIEHLLHAGAALGAFVADHDHFTGLDRAIQNAGNRRVLALEYPGRATEAEVLVIHPGRFYDGAIKGQVAGEHGEAPLQAVGMLQRADAPLGSVHIQLGPAAILAERLGGADASWPGAVEVHHLLARLAADVVFVEQLGQGAAQYGTGVTVHQTRLLQLTQNGDHATGTVHIFHMVLLGRGGHLAQLGHLARHAIDIGHGEVHPGLLGRRQQVQHRIGGTAHGDIQRHGILERRLGGDVAWQGALVILLVVTLGKGDDALACQLEQLLAIGMGRQHGAVARLGKPQRLGQAVHGVGSKHAGTGAAGRASAALHLFALSIGDLGVGALDHGVHQIQFDDLIGQLGLARFHGAAGDEDHRDVDAQGSHQHPRGDLVAVGDADHGVGTVGVDHVLHRVGDQLARRQRIEHAAVAHGDAVIHGYGIELFGHAAGGFDLAGHQLAQILEVDVTRYELGEGVDHGYDGLAEILVCHASGAPEGAGPGHVTSVGGGGGSQLRHCLYSLNAHGAHDFLNV